MKECDALTVHTQWEGVIDVKESITHRAWDAIWWVVKWDFASALHRWSHCWPVALNLTLYILVDIHFLVSMQFPNCAVLHVLLFSCSRLHIHSFSVKVCCDNYVFRPLKLDVWKRGQQFLDKWFISHRPTPLPPCQCQDTRNRTFSIPTLSLFHFHHSLFLTRFFAFIHLHSFILLTALPPNLTRKASPQIVVK